MPLSFPSHHDLLFLVSGLMRFVHWPIASNDECIMLPQFTMERFLEAIVRYQVTDVSLVPSIILRLVRDPAVDNYDLKCLQRIACGAAPLSVEVLGELQRKFPWTGFRQSYGMTESCCTLTTHPPEFYDYKYGTSGGMLLGSTFIKIINISTNREAGVNEVGELLAKGPQVAMGYLDNARETAETFGTEGWLRTGDIGSIDDHGFIHIVDRIKEMIKVKGQQVAPAELENLLLGHVDVDDCAVIGIQDQETERPKAYVVLKPDIKPSEMLGAQLIQYVKDHKVRYKWLRELEFVAEIPKSPSSKTLRRVLRERHTNNQKGFFVCEGPGPKL